jgi:hypothetical protein
VIVSAGVAIVRTDRHELASVRRVCDRIPPDASVVIVDRSSADRLMQVIRGMCGVPTARSLSTAKPEDVRRVAGRIQGAGRRAVILGSQARHVAPYGAPVRVVAMRARQDERTLTEPPNGTWSLSLNVWICEPA